MRKRIMAASPFSRELQSETGDFLIKKNIAYDWCNVLIYLFDKQQISLFFFGKSAERLTFANELLKDK